MDKIFITGCSSGVGKVMAKNLAGDHHVIVSARRVERMKKEFKGLKNISIYKTTWRISIVQYKLSTGWSKTLVTYLT